MYTASLISINFKISVDLAFLYEFYISDLLMMIQKEAEAGRLPINIAQGMTELYHNYRDAVK